MTDHAEEQEMEAEALTAIFDQQFEMRDKTHWALEVYPETGDPSELDALNHVACRLVVDLPSDYPEVSLPNLHVEIIKGLVDEHREQLQQLADEEAEANAGVPSIFAIVERLREWLLDNNQKGLDDVSMHAQMMRKKVEQEKAKQKAQAKFESHSKLEVMTEAEQEEMAVRKRREEGTPCNKENFEAWKAQFDAELAQSGKANTTTENGDDSNNTGKSRRQKSTVDDDKSGKITGKEYFSSKANNLEALELAAEQAENEEMDEEEMDDVNEELFEDDIDLDDLDFDDEDEDEDDEVDI